MMHARVRARTCGKSPGLPKQATSVEYVARLYELDGLIRLSLERTAFAARLHAEASSGFGREGALQAPYRSTAVVHEVHLPFSCFRAVSDRRLHPHAHAEHLGMRNG